MLGARGFIVCVVMLMTLFGVACGSTGNDQGNSSQEPRDTEASPDSDTAAGETTQQQPNGNAPSQQNLSLGDTANFGYGDTVTVYSYTHPARPTNDIWTPTPGTQYAAIDVEGCAGNVEATDAGNTQMTFEGLSFSLQMPDNTRIQPSVPAIDPVLPASSLPPGECVRGNVTFEIPQGGDPSYILFTKPSQESAKWAIKG